MKKIFVILLTAVCLMMFGGCKEDEPVDEIPQKTITTLEGTWVGYEEKENEERWQYKYEATISDGIITIIRRRSGSIDEKKYFIGTYVGPEEAVSEYYWESDANAGEDYEKLDDDGLIGTKKATFTYKDEKLSFLYKPYLEHDMYDNPYIYLEKVD